MAIYVCTCGMCPDRFFWCYCTTSTLMHECSFSLSICPSACALYCNNVANIFWITIFFIYVVLIRLAVQTEYIHAFPTNLKKEWRNGAEQSYIVHPVSPSSLKRGGVSHLCWQENDLPRELSRVSVQSTPVRKQGGRTKLSVALRSYNRAVHTTRCLITGLALAARGDYAIKNSPTCAFLLYLVILFFSCL